MYYKKKYLELLFSVGSGIFVYME